MEIWMVAVGVLCVAAACVHGYLGETRLIAPSNFPNRQAKQLVSAIWQFSTLAWARCGVLIAVLPWLYVPEHRALGVLLSCIPLVYGIAINAAITRGRHFGWKIFAAIVVAAIAGSLMHTA